MPMADAPVCYAIDPKLSRFSVQAFAGGLLSGFGHNPTFAVRDFTGEAKFSPEAPKDGSLLMKIKSASLQLTTDVNDKDRREIERTMREDVLDTESNPEIRYEGSVVSISEPGPGRYRVNLMGQLFLHGVSRDLPMVADLGCRTRNGARVQQLHRLSNRVRYPAGFRRGRRDEGEGRAEVHLRHRGAKVRGRESGWLLMCLAIPGKIIRVNARATTTPRWSM